MDALTTKHAQIYLKILFPVKSDCLGLQFLTFHNKVHLVPTQEYRNVSTDSQQVSVPGRDVLVRDPGGNIHHDDGTLPLDVVVVSRISQFFLSSGVTYFEADRSSVGVKHQRWHI